MAWYTIRAVKVVVVTVNYNRASDTIDLIKSIKKSDLANSELLVIDNGSTNDSLATFKTGKNLGFAGGYNFGMKKALELGAEAVLIINNDTLVSPVFLTPLVKALNSDLTVGAVSPMTYYADGKKIWWGGGKINLRLGQINNVGGEVTCDYLSGVCILFKREVLEKVGLFDEHFTHTGEDVDLSIRIRQAGYKLLMVPESKLVHKVSQTGGGEWSPFHLYNVEKYRLLLMKKWGYWRGIVSLILLLPLFIWRLGGAVIKGDGLSSIAALLRGWYDGYYEKLT